MNNYLAVTYKRDTVKFSDLVWDHMIFIFVDFGKFKFDGYEGRLPNYNSLSIILPSLIIMKNLPHPQ